MSSRSFPQRMGSTGLGVTARLVDFKEEKKLTLEDYARVMKVIGNPQKLAIVFILYASEVLEHEEEK